MARMFGVIERRRGLRFAKNEAFFFFRGTDQVGSKKLEGDRTFELRVLSPVDDTHAAFAELGHDLVVADGSADNAGLILP